jgi:hypothetical protein
MAAAADKMRKRLSEAFESLEQKETNSCPTKTGAGIRNTSELTSVEGGSRTQVQAQQVQDSINEDMFLEDFPELLTQDRKV